MQKSYSELISISSFDERFEYLRFSARVGEITFGSHRYLNQKFYQSKAWKRIRNKVVSRDNGCDLAHQDYPIYGSIYIHHINPITIDDIIQERPIVFDMENLVCVEFKTHNMLHYGSENTPKIPREIVRVSRDTCLW